MIKKKYLLVILGVTLILTGCQTQSNKTAVKQLTASQLLKKVQLAMSPSGKLTKPKNYKVTLKMLVIHNSVRTTKNAVIYCLKPDKYILNIESLINKPGGSVKETLAVFINGNNIIWEKKDGKEIDIDSLEDNELTNLQEQLKQIENLVSFFMFMPNYGLELGNGVYDIEGFKCYKLKSILGARSSSGSDENTYYIDTKDFMVRKIVSDAGTVTNIEYKKFGQVTLPYKYKYSELEIVHRRSYFEIKDFKINYNIDKTLFKTPEILGQKI